jgi:hypothetical protein
MDLLKKTSLTIQDTCRAKALDIIFIINLSLKAGVNGTICFRALARHRFLQSLTIKQNCKT